MHMLVWTLLKRGSKIRGGDVGAGSGTSCKRSHSDSLLSA